MKSMALTKAEAKEMEDSTVPSAEVDELPKYPYGLSLYLHDEVMKKLGLKEMPAVGTVLNLAAKVVVTGTSERKYQGGEVEQCLDIQITDMELAEPGDRMSKAAARLYPDKD